MPTRKQIRKRQTRRGKKQIKINEQKSLKSFTDLLNSSTLNFSQEDIDTLLESILKLRPQ